MAMNSSPARSVRESIDTPATQAMASSPLPRLPATASATCVTVHRIVASIGWLSQGFVPMPIALLRAFSEGSSFVRHSPLWLASPRHSFAQLLDKRATCQTLRHPSAFPRTHDRPALCAPLLDRRSESYGPQKSGSPRDPFPPTRRCLRSAPLQSPA